MRQIYVKIHKIQEKVEKKGEIENNGRKKIDPHWSTNSTNMLGDRGDRSAITSHVQIVYKVMKFGCETCDFEIVNLMPGPWLKSCIFDKLTVPWEPCGWPVLSLNRRCMVSLWRLHADLTSRSGFHMYPPQGPRRVTKASEIDSVDHLKCVFYVAADLLYSH